MRKPRLRLRSAALAVLLTLPGGASFAAADGTPDPGFNGNGRAVMDIGESAGLRAVAAAPDGKMVVVGSANFPAGEDWSNTAWVVARWNADGTRDTTFGPAHTGIVRIELDLGPVGVRYDSGTSVAVQPNGKVVIAGLAKVSSSQSWAAVARLTADGNLDTSFAGSGKLTLGQLGNAFDCRLRLRRGGQIVVTPSLVSGNNVVVQLTSDGYLDPMFGLGGVTEAWSCGSPACGWFFDALELPDGKLLAIGMTPSRDHFFLVRFFGTLYHTGEVDEAFGDQGVAAFAPAGFSKIEVLGFALDTSARVTVLGDNPDHPEQTALLRLRNDQPDPTFGTGGWAMLTYRPPSSTTDGTPMALLLQADGKALVAGTGLVNGTWNFVVTRLTANGRAVDTTFSGGWSTIAFDVGGGLTDFPTAMATSSGRPLIAGLAGSSSTWLYAATRLDNSFLWSDGFESGSTWFWSGQN